MRALTYDRYGPIDTPRWRSVEDPLAPTENQIRLRVSAVGLNPIDGKLITGQMPSVGFRGWPKIPGHDIAGTVQAIGHKVTRFKKGDWVATLTPVGGRGGLGLAEAVTVSADDAALIPVGLSPVHAAAIPMAGLTAYSALANKASIDPGMRVLVIGASGGVGHLAIQLARAFGAEVTAVARAANHEFLRSLGFENLLDYQVTPLSRHTGDYDVVLDLVGRSNLSELAHMLTPTGVLVGTSSLPGILVNAAMNAFRRGPKARFVHVRPDGTTLDLLLRWAAEGRVRVHVNTVYPAERAVDALGLVNAGHTRGKIVVAMDPELITRR